MMQKKIAAGLAVLLAAGTILGGCGESGAAGNDSVSDAAGNEAAALTEAKTTPYGRYPETITYTLAKMTGVNNSNLPEGETYEDNASFDVQMKIAQIIHLSEVLANAKTNMVNASSEYSSKIRESEDRKSVV